MKPRVKLYKRGNSPYWYVDYFDLAGERRQFSLGISDKKTANERRTEIELMLSRGIDPVEESKKSVTLSEFIDKYLLHCKHSNTKSTFEGKVRKANIIKKALGDYPLTELTTRIIERYRADRRETVTAATVNRGIAMLKHAFNLAIEWGYLEENPAGKIQQYREPPGRVRYLSREQLSALLNACEKDLSRVIITAVMTGLRKGELLSLSVSDIDLDKEQLTVIKGKNQDRRTIPLNADAIEAIRESTNGREKGEVFIIPNLRSRFEKAIKEIGLEDFTFHDLRHTFASWLVMEGVGIYEVKELLGHKDIKMTMRYAHLAPDYLKNSVSRLHIRDN